MTLTVAMKTLYIDLEIAQTPKIRGSVCGDVVDVLRTPEATYVFLADGLKSGIHANLAAEFCLARLRAKIENGTSLLQALHDVLLTLEINRRELSLWTALLAVSLSPSGVCTIYNYEMPPVLHASRRRLHMLSSHPIHLGGTLLAQSVLELVEQEGLVLVSDGITQAGLGSSHPWGWGIEGVQREAESFLTHEPIRRLPQFLIGRAEALNGAEQGDDCSAVVLLTRLARRVVILTGPPADPTRDEEAVRRFLNSEGCRVVCGGTTAGIVARYLGVDAVVDTRSLHPLCPPRYRLDGVDYATEGAVCLDQLRNLLEAAPSRLEDRNVVTDLYRVLCEADLVEFLVGTAENPANASQSFLQRGILDRRTVVTSIAEKLQRMGKIVTIEWL